MGTVKTTWLLPGHSGRACHHEAIYTKQNKKTSKVYSVQLCNPNTEWNENQIAKRTLFGKISSAISAWINENKVETAANHADYLKVLKQFDRQTKYATLRGMMYGKGMYVIDEDENVTIDITANTSTAGSSSNAGSGTASTYKVTLAASPSNGGTVSGAGSYTAGASAAISAVAASGYTFSKWSDNDTNASRSVTVNSNLSLTAIFTKDESSSDNSGGGGNDDENMEMP